MLSFEGVYRKRGGTFLAELFGTDPFDFWIGRFYVGIFGAVTLVPRSWGLQSSHSPSGESVTAISFA